MSRLNVYFLGPPLIELDGQRVQLGRHKAVALLAYLALARQPYARDALATLLWPELDQSSARGQLRRTLSLLNRTLGKEWLTVDREAAEWAGHAGAWTDVEAVRERLAACAAHRHPPDQACPDCIPLLEEAVDLYRDGFLAGFTLPDAPDFDEWQFFEGERLRDEIADAMQRLARWHGDRAEYESAIPHARHWLALDALHEPAQRELMALYARSGQRAAALRQYEECKRVLEEELGIRPAPETVVLYERIRDGQDLSGLPNLTGLRALPSHNLPEQLTPFVGREEELAELGDLLAPTAEARLVTVVGPGGMGKTRLALEAASRQLDRYPDGVWFVSLASTESPEAIARAVAQALGVSFFGTDPPNQQLLRHLREKRLLLVLDNLEHLLEGVGLLVEILRTAPGVHLLATSRVWLNARGEQILDLHGMNYPELQDGMPPADDMRRYDSVALFTRNARRAHATFELTDENLTHVAGICYLAQGMPLAILLAAAWVPTLTPGEIAAEMERSLGFLAADWRDEPERHHSMRAVFDATWGMLTEEERQVFARLSVFRGGFTREAAQQVVGGDLPRGQGLLPTLRSLVHKSFLQVDQEGRYAVHELLRQYGERKLSADPLRLQQVRERHAACYAGAAVGWEAGLKGIRRREVMAEMGLEIHNAQAAWQWLSERGDAVRLAQMIDAMGWFYASPGWYQQGERAFGAAVDRLLPAEQAVVEIAQLQHLEGRLLTWQGRYAFASARGADADGLLCRAQAALDEAERAGQDVRAARAWLLHSMWERAADVDRGTFRGLAEQSLALYRELDDPWGVVCVLSDLGISSFFDGSYRLARQIFEECLALSRQWAIEKGADDSVWWLSWIAVYQGEVDWAERMARDMTAPWLASDDPMVRSYCLWLPGSILSLAGQYSASKPLLEECAALLHNLGADVLLYRLLPSLAKTMQNLGHYERACALGREDLERAQDMEAWVIASMALMSQAQVSVVVGAYEEAARTLEESIATLRRAGARGYLGQALGAMAYAVRKLGQAEEAWACVREALRLGVECEAVHPLLLALPAASLLLADQGQSERAVELYALASRYPVVANSRWYEDVAGRELAAVAAALPPEVREAALARGQARDLWTTARELPAEVEEDEA